jgi:hypothetical protein
VDCAPTDPTIHEGADEIGYDGIDQDCVGGDDYDLDADGAQAVPWGPDENDQSTRITMSLAVTGSCQSLMDFVIDGATPGRTVELWQGELGPYQSDFPSWHPCDLPEAYPDLNAPLVRAANTTADANGRAVFAGIPGGAGACGVWAFQALDRATCELSGEHAAPP